MAPFCVKQFLIISKSSLITSKFGPSTSLINIAPASTGKPLLNFCSTALILKESKNSIATGVTPAAIVLYTAFIAEFTLGNTPIAVFLNLGLAINFRVISVIAAKLPSLAIKIPAILYPATSFIVFLPALIICPLGNTARKAIT